MDIELKSYSDVITPITSIASNSNPEDFNESIRILSTTFEIPTEELLMLPSSIDNLKLSVLVNSVFIEAKKNNMDIASLFNLINIKNESSPQIIALKSRFDAIKVYAQDSRGMTNGKFDSVKLEQYVMQENSQYLTKVDIPDGTNNDDTITFKGKTYKTVVSEVTNRIWLDRNLGASEVCGTTNNDDACVGDLYQWGRKADGHEKITSEANGTYGLKVPYSTLADDHDFVGKFILESVLHDYQGGYDWLDWQGPSAEVLGWDVEGKSDAQIEDEFPWLYKDKYGVWRDDDVGDFSPDLSRYKAWLEDRTLHWHNSKGRGICPVGYRVAIFAEYRDETNGNFLNFKSKKRSAVDGEISDSNLVWTQTYNLDTFSDSKAVIFNFDFFEEEHDVKEENYTSGLPVRCINALPNE